MGNCQAVDAAVLVIQHPCGKIDRLYWPVTATEVMKTNPGHYVSLIIPLPVSQQQQHQQHQQQQQQQQQKKEQKTVSFTRVKLLRPNETLNLGHAYRLVTTQEVMKVLKAKKHAKTRKQQAETVEKPQAVKQEKQSSASESLMEESDQRKTYQAVRAGRNRPRAASVNPATLGSKSWRPSLQSISESAS